MKRLAPTLALTALAATALAAAALVAAPAAYAALQPGAQAPAFIAPAAMDGKDFTYKLADALKKGPVVVYFYPKAFTSGCSLEAHEFAAATDQFKAMGATVIGVSRDDIGTLEKFSTQVCQSKFPVASDKDGSIVRSYDVSMGIMPMSNRTSFVIAPSGKIVYVYSDLNAAKHVENTLAAVKSIGKT
jgi:peroxiredoxin